MSVHATQYFKPYICGLMTKGQSRGGLSLGLAYPGVNAAETLLSDSVNSKTLNYAHIRYRIYNTITTLPSIDLLNSIQNLSGFVYILRSLCTDDAFEPMNQVFNTNTWIRTFME